MTQILKLAFLVVLLLNLTACGTTWFADPKTSPVIEDKVGVWGKEKVGTLAVTADRRVVIVRLDDKTKFCAEPPPDVAENITEKLAAALTAKVADKGELSAEYSKDLKKTIQALISRTQGADIYRTGMYSLCQYYVNDGDGAWVKTHSKEILDVAENLILAEFKANVEMSTAIAVQEAKEATSTTPIPTAIRAETASGGISEK